MRRPARTGHDRLPRGSVAPTASAAFEAASADSSVELEKLLFHSLIRSADYRGSDVRLDTGELFIEHLHPLQE